MPCVCRKPNSPYWMAKFRDGTGRVVMRSTKKTVHRDALKIALMWEDATHRRAAWRAYAGGECKNPSRSDGADHARDAQDAVDPGDAR